MDNVLFFSFLSLPLLSPPPLVISFHSQIAEGFTPKVLSLVDLAVQGAKDGIVVIACPLTVLEDLCDCAVLKDCEQIFDYVESKLSDWPVSNLFIDIYIVYK